VNKSIGSNSKEGVPFPIKIKQLYETTTLNNKEDSGLDYQTFETRRSEISLRLKDDQAQDEKQY
jgi:hypothetical protein